jgi:AraC-like DNA-binding protein
MGPDDLVLPLITQPDSELGQWISAQWTPPEASRLRPFVESVWYFHGATAYSRERIFPDGSAELIVQLDDVYRDGDKGSIPFPTVCVNGLRTRPSVVEAPGTRCRVLGVRFTAIGACAILGQPIRELTDVTVDLDDCDGAPARELGERCADAAAAIHASHAAVATGVVRVAATWALTRLDRQRAADPIVLWTAERIRSAGGVVSVEGLRDRTGLERSRFARRFREALGVTPKRYARILRFHRALDLIARDGEIARAAQALDYFDQSHLYRDFREFAAMTPAAFFAANRYPESTHIAE